MFTSVSHSYSLKLALLHVREISPAFGQTLVIFAKHKQKRKDVLFHFNKNGRIVFKFVTQASTNSFIMINDRKAAIFSIKDNQITIIDLQSHVIKKYYHQYVSQCKTTLTAYLFTETDLICLVEKQASKFFTITYYKMNEDLQKIKRYSAQQGEVVYKDWVVKGNNHSMIIWGKQHQKKTLVLNIYQLNKTIEYQEVLNIVGISFEQFYAKFGNSQLTLINVWQNRKDNLLAICNTDQTNKDNAMEVISINTKQNTLRQIKFHMQSHCLLPLIYNLGDYSIFPTFRFHQGKAVESPIYFIENASENIVSQMSWKYDSSHHLNLDISRNKVLLSQYPCESEVKQIKITQFRLDYPSIYMRFMLQVNEQFDDDILLDAIQMLTHQ